MLRITHINKHLKSMICFLVLVLCTKINAQIDSVIKAQELCRDKQFDKAISILDKVILHPNTKNDAASWHTRSFAYINQAKLMKLNSNKAEQFIDIAIKSSLESIKLDTTKEYFELNKKFIESGAKQYYVLARNIIETSLTLNTYIKAEELYENYKKHIKIVIPNFSTIEKDIEFYNVIGGYFATLYSNDTLLINPLSSKHLEIAKYAYKKVLSVSSNDLKANEGLGVLYFNNGANLYKALDYSADIFVANQMQDDSEKLFKQSKGHMELVYKYNPNSEKVLNALEGIYWGLNQPEISKEFKLLRESLKK